MKVALYETQLEAVFSMTIIGFYPYRKLLRENLRQS
jgi:hypothetical protein